MLSLLPPCPPPIGSKIAASMYASRTKHLEDAATIEDLQWRLQAAVSEVALWKHRFKVQQENATATVEAHIKAQQKLERCVKARGDRLEMMEYEIATLKHDLQWHKMELFNEQIEHEEKHEEMMQKLKDLRENALGLDKETLVNEQIEQEHLQDDFEYQYDELQRVYSALKKQKSKDRLLICELDEAKKKQASVMAKLELLLLEKEESEAQLKVIRSSDTSFRLQPIDKAAATVPAVGGDIIDCSKVTRMRVTPDGRTSAKWRRQMIKVANGSRLSPNNIDGLEKLGQGGFGLVWKGNLKTTPTGPTIQVAIKEWTEEIDHPRLDHVDEYENKDDGALTSTLLATLQTHCILSSDAACSAFITKPLGIMVDFPTKGKVSLVAELFEGKDLSSVDLRTLPLQSKTFIVRKLGLAVDCMHRRGVFWGDLKKSNAMISRQEQALNIRLACLDFDSCEFYKLTKCCPKVYSKGYAAPEILQEIDADVGPASDVYAYGHLVEELFSRRANGGVRRTKAELTFISKVLEIAGRCKAYYPSDRCSLQEVEQVLSSVRWT